jgi:hypothetical protein
MSSRRALDPADDYEARGMSRALAALCPREEMMHVALSLVGSRRRYAWPFEDAIAELDDPSASLRLREEEVRRRDHRSARRSLAQIAARVDRSDEQAINSAGYVAAATRSQDPALIALAKASPRAFLSGMLDAFADGSAGSWTSALPFLDAFPVSLLELYTAPDGLIGQAQRRSAPNAIDVTDRVRELEAQADQPRLANLLARGDADALEEVLINARYFESDAQELQEPTRRILARLVQQSWPSEGIAGSINQPGSHHWMEPAAQAVLCYGPAIELDLTARQWADVASRGYSFGSEGEWLRKQWTPAAMRETLNLCNDERADIWADVLEGTPDPVPHELVEAIAGRIRTVDDSARGYEIIRRLGEGAEIDAIREIVGRIPELAGVARPALAEAGDGSAQRALLADLADRFSTTVGIDSDDLSWMHAVNDPTLRETVFELLPRSYNHSPGPGRLNDTMGVLHNTIRRIGGQAAVQRYDELLARPEPAWSGVQFVRLHRDEVARDLLDEASRDVEPAFREQLLHAA